MNKPYTATYQALARQLHFEPVQSAISAKEIYQRDISWNEKQHSQ